jgi:hypothetical protein
MNQELTDDEKKEAARLREALKKIPWFVPQTTLHLADGSTLVKPGKAIQRGQAKHVAKAFDISLRTLSLLAEAGHIRAARVGPQLTYYYPGEIEEFFRKMESEPDYWNAKRRREYGLIRAGKGKGGKAQ